MATYNFTIRATDSLGAYADRAFSVDVDNTLVENFVAIGNGAYVLTSKDGITWTQRAVSSQLKGVGYGNGKWIGYSDTYIATSTDAINWTYSTVSSVFPAFNTRVPVCIAYNSSAGRWLIGCNSTGSSYPTATCHSDDNGATWSSPVTVNSADNTTGYMLNYIANNGNKLITGNIGRVDTFYISTDDSATWSVNSITDGAYVCKIVYAAGIWLAVPYGRTNSIVSYDNGVNWVYVANQLNNATTQTTAAYGNGIWLQMGTNASTSRYMGRSTNGLTWSSVASPPATTSSADMAFGCGRFVVVQNANTAFYHSTDGITWTSGTLPANTSVPYPATAGGARATCSIAVRV